MRSQLFNYKIKCNMGKETEVKKSRNIQPKR